MCYKNRPVIYLITNHINGKIYIGKTVRTATTRFRIHRNGSAKGRNKLSCAMRKYGIENFSIQTIFEILNYEKLTKKEVTDILNWAEIALIAEYRSYEDPDIGYNMTPGGDGGRNEASMIASSKKRKCKTYDEIYGPELAADIIARAKSRPGPNPGKPMAEKTKKKLSRTLKHRHAIDQVFHERVAKKNKEIAKSGEEHHMFGKTHTEEARKKISKSRVGKTYEEIFGEEEAAKQRTWRKEKYKGSGNPFYKKMNLKPILEALVENPKITMGDLGKQFNISRPTLTLRIKEVFSIDNYQHFRYSMTDEEFIELLKEKINAMA